MVDFETIPAIERFIQALGANIRFLESEWATYHSFTDVICVPPPGSRRTELHYMLLLHEHAHWTGHHSRLARTFGLTTNDPDYALEEITAIVATLHLCAYFGILTFGIANQLEYAQRYLPVIADDNRAMCSALREGRRAVLYLHERQGTGRVFSDDVLFRSVDTLATACFTVMPPPKPAAITCSPVPRSPLAPLVERFATVPRVRFA
jgi:antirestriction protein ArdC